MKIEDNNNNYINYIYNIKYVIDNRKEIDYWPFIPMEVETLYFLYTLYEKYNCKSIIDLGCGAFNVLRYANNIGYETTGVDFEDFSMYSRGHIFIHKDIRELDINTYSKYDVIYIALPLKIGKGFEEYISKVQDNMKIGQYIITPLYIIEDDRFERIDQNTFVKQK